MPPKGSGVRAAFRPRDGRSDPSLLTSPRLVRLGAVRVNADFLSEKHPKVRTILLFSENTTQTLPLVYYRASTVTGTRHAE
jgi:hypothetical protein